MNEENHSTNVDEKQNQEIWKIRKEKMLKAIIVFLKIFLAAIIIAGIYFLFNLLNKTQTFPVYVIFLIPIFAGFFGSLLYFWKRTKYFICWCTDLSLAASAMVITTASITKAYDKEWYDSIGLGQSGYSAAVLSYISFCAIMKLMIIIFSFTEYEKKYS